MLCEMLYSLLDTSLHVTVLRSLFYRRGLVYSPLYHHVRCKSQLDIAVNDHAPFSRLRAKQCPPYGKPAHISSESLCIDIVLEMSLARHVRNLNISDE